MRKIADLYLNEDVNNHNYKVVAHENMKEENTGLVEDLMRTAKVKMQIDNSCKALKSTTRVSKDIVIADFKVDVNAILSAKIQIKIFLLKLDDVNDLKISLYSLVGAPGMQ